MRLTCRRVLCWPGALIVALGVAAPAHAQITSSHIATPADPHFVLYDTDAAQPATVAVAGTATGTGAVDVVCVRGTEVTPVASGVAVAPNGTFAVPAAPLDQIADAGHPRNSSRTCRLHAVPAGLTPTNFAAFAGPRLGVSKLSRERLSGTGNVDNDGLLWDYYLYGAGAGFAADYVSFGACGVFDSMPQDPTTLVNLGFGLFCNGAPNSLTGATWGLRIDGGPAYPPGGLGGGTGGAGLQGNPGFRELVVDPPSLNASNGDITLTETDPLAKCAPDNVYPPTFAGCTSFAPVPVTLKRTTQQTSNGQVIRVVDRWSSTDGHVHGLDLHLRQEYCFGTDASPCSTHIVYRFPGQAAYAAHDADAGTPATASIAGPLAAAEPILAKDATNTTVGGAAIVPAQSSGGATFSGQDTFTLDYPSRTIPATGALTLTHYYVTGRTPVQTEQLAAAVSASLRPTPPPPSGPGGGAGGGGTVTPTPARPKLSRHGRPGVRRAGKTFVVATGYRASCPKGGADCVVRVTATAPVRASAARTHRIIVGRARIKVRAGKTAKVSFRLNRKAARALKQTRRLKLSIALSARAGTGKSVTRKRSVTIRTPRA